MKSRKPRKPSTETLPLQLTNDQPFTARRLRLFFEPTRTVLVDAFVGTPPPKAKATVKPVKLAFELDLDPAGVASGSVLTVGVRYQRTRPQLAGAIWLPPPPPVPASGAAPAATTAEKPLAKLPYTKSPAELAKLRRDQIAARTGLERKRMEFFLQLDIDTDPALAGLNGKSAAQLKKLHDATREVQLVLLDRVTKRGRFGLLTANLTDPMQSPTFRTSLKLVTKYLEDLVEKFGIDRPGDPLPGLDATFEGFARGDLRVLATIKAEDGTEVSYSLNGEPDSANYFLLGELALFACAENPASQLWPRLLRVFVRTQEIYCQAYAPRGAALQTWPDFTHQTWRGPGVPADGVVEALRAKYATMGVEDLEIQATTNLQNAFNW